MTVSSLSDFFFYSLPRPVPRSNIMHKKARRKIWRETTFQSPRISKTLSARQDRDQTSNSPQGLTEGGGKQRSRSTRSSCLVHSSSLLLVLRPPQSSLPQSVRATHEPTDRIPTRNTPRPRTTCPPRGERKRANKIPPTVASSSVEQPPDDPRKPRAKSP